MDTPNDRLRQLIEKEPGTLRDWCKKYNVDYKTFQLMTSGTRPVSIKKLTPLQGIVPGLDLNEILTGTKSYESVHSSGNDLMEDVLLKYLSSNKIKAQIGEIVKEKLIEMQMNLGDNDADLAEKVSNELFSQKGKGNKG